MDMPVPLKPAAGEGAPGPGKTKPLRRSRASGCAKKVVPFLPHPAAFVTHDDNVQRMVTDTAPCWPGQTRRKRLDAAMLKRLKNVLVQVSVPDEQDMAEHYRTPAEKTADLIVHVVGLTLAGVGGIVLAVLAAIHIGIGAVFATSTYALCLILMLTVSALYNQAHPGAARPLLRRMDEAAIFLMIAGSYTPFTTQRFEGGWSIGFTVLVWAVALGGVAVKLLAPRISDTFWSLVYLGFSWLALAAAKPLIDTVHPVALGLLVLGGLIYTAGVFVFISPTVKFRRAIWHGFVVTGATVHWAAVLVGVVLAPAAMG
jgi:hemolysin III